MNMSERNQGGARRVDQEKHLRHVLTRPSGQDANIRDDAGCLRPQSRVSESKIRWIMPVEMFKINSSPACSCAEVIEDAEDIDPDSERDGVDELDATEVGEADLGREALARNLPLRVASGRNSPSWMARSTCSYFRSGPAKSSRE